MNKQTQKLTFSGICLALCLLLPFLTGQIPQIGNMISPMHIPVLLCGLLAGAPYGALVGFIAPLLRTALFSMPPVMVSVRMAFELMAYGFIAGILVNRLPKTLPCLYASLIGAMFLGRIVWGIASVIILGAVGMPFTFEMFLAGGFLEAIPAIILHILIIPPIVLALRKTGLGRS